MKVSNEKEIVLTHEGLSLMGILGIPKSARSIIIFAHGSGSGRFSPRNNYVAHVLQENGFATLLLDLLLEEEANDRRNVFDIQLLANRLLMAKHWLSENIETKSMQIGYFGASTGAGAALVAAALDKENVFAVVSRGGRPDLAQDYLKKVTVPTLLLVGGADGVVIDLNQSAFSRLNTIKDLIIIPHATHLFEEPGALEQVADWASKWFKRFENGNTNEEVR